MKKSEIIRQATREFSTQISFVMYLFAFVMCLAYADVPWTVCLVFAAFLVGFGWTAVIAVALFLQCAESASSWFEGLHR